MKAVLPVLDESRNRPYYIQLYDYLREAILRGEIAEDERLPSLRSLARSTGLSITTVEKAYNQLLVEGYIRSRAQSGYYAVRVASGDTSSVPSETAGFPSELYTGENTGLAQAQKWRWDPECFDFNKWKKCMNRVLNEYSSTLFFEGSPQGEPALRSEIARYLYRSRGVSCLPEQIFIAAGTQQITNYLATILKDLQVEHVALEDPGYAPVRSTFRDRGFAITPVEVSSDGLVLEKLPVNIRAAAYVSPSNHSFTGSVMPAGRRYELLRWANANDSYIIEDDYDSELRYFGRPIPALRSLTDDGRVIYLGSFSSTLFAAVKISYMVLPPQIAGDFTEALRGYSQTCSKLEQLTLAIFMQTGWYQTHIRKLRKLYSQKLTRLSEAFRREGAGFVSLRSTSSGISVLLTVRSGKEPEQLKKDADDLGIPISGSSEPGLLILYYNQIPLEEISGVISDLCRRWRS